ncbi:MAG: CYTH domain-containing protein [Methylobacterium mesophilicum]|nr:CYTH domain-containing protein [Methylobacterium mesophilicum]
MAREIERKFLVRHEGWREQVSRASSIVQAYLGAAPGLSIRLRIRDGETAFLTVKSAEKGLSRSEFEYPIPVPDAEAMIALSQGPRLQKTRHDVMLGDLKWEVDVFEGVNAGLVLVEVELPSEDHAVPLPDWIGEEVTGDPRFYNEQLAQMPPSA